MNQYKKFYFLRGICFEQITLTSMIGKSEIVRFFRKLIFLRIFSENFKWIQQMLFNSLKITIHIHYCFLKMKNWWSIESFFLNSEFLYSIRYCFFNNLKNTLLFYRSGLHSWTNFLSNFICISKKWHMELNWHKYPLYTELLNFEMNSCQVELKSYQVYSNVQWIK